MHHQQLCRHGAMDEEWTLFGSHPDARRGERPGWWAAEASVFARHYDGWRVFDGIPARTDVHRSRSRRQFCAAFGPTTNDESDKARSMSGFKEPSFADRQKAAQQARKDILNKFRSQPGVDDPAVIQRRAEREAQAAERAKAKLAREAAKAEQKIRDAEAAAQAAAQLLREKEEAVAQEAALEAEKKAARDARYAARKKRK
jgi:hypothetical protein